MTYFEVDWKPTLEPEHNLEHAKELIKMWRDGKPASGIGRTRRTKTGTHNGWEIFAILGEVKIAGEVYFLVDWMPTLEPEDNLEHAKESIKTWRMKNVAEGRGRN